VVVVDTNVLQKANAPLGPVIKEGRKIRRRLELLSQIRRREVTILYSRQLVHEYRTQIQHPRNEFVRAFFEVITGGANAIFNWRTPWRSDRVIARECRYPDHDDHVLRTALHDDSTTIYTEDEPMLRAGECIYRRLRVRIQDPT
jgi:predicted nucleic acid-binding protein